MKGKKHMPSISRQHNTVLPVVHNRTIFHVNEVTI